MPRQGGNGESERQRLGLPVHPFDSFFGPRSHRADDLPRGVEATPQPRRPSRHEPFISYQLSLAPNRPKRAHDRRTGRNATCWQGCGRNPCGKLIGAKMPGLTASPF